MIRTCTDCRRNPTSIYVYPFFQSICENCYDKYLASFVPCDANGVKVTVTN
jgi:hypothetical protein